MRMWVEALADGLLTRGEIMRISSARDKSGLIVDVGVWRVVVVVVAYCLGN